MVTFSPAQTFRGKCKTSVIPLWGIWLILENGLALVCFFLCFCFEYIWVHQLPFNITSRAAWKTMSVLKYKTSHLQDSHREARCDPEVTGVTWHSWQQMRPGTGPRSPWLCCLSHPLCPRVDCYFTEVCETSACIKEQIINQLQFSAFLFCQKHCFRTKEERQKDLLSNIPQEI